MSFLWVSTKSHDPYLAKFLLARRLPPLPSFKSDAHTEMTEYYYRYIQDQIRNRI